MLFAGIFRAVFLSSLILFFFHISPLEPKFYSKNISYRLFRNFAPKSYPMFFAVYKKFRPETELNKGVKDFCELKEEVNDETEKVLR
ncbi:MAG: hypothetical protein JW867_08110, partial [Candidatus Omnitrophica bacterium]|nr:hypothetical protein [Candidatus Omnitrophota bacterium]